MVTWARGTVLVPVSECDGVWSSRRLLPFAKKQSYDVVCEWLNSKALLGTGEKLKRKEWL